jgi:prephenate dehydrogenase
VAERGISPVLIIGSGLIGTSLGLSLRRVGTDVLLDDRDEAKRDEAVAMGAGRPWDGSTQPQIVILAVPPSEVAKRIAEAAQQFPDATLTDVASVKSRIVQEALAAGVPAERYIGGHPMAGRELSGPSAARADLVDDRLWILTPLEHTDPTRLTQIKELVRTCGGVVREMSPAQHDQAVALVSHVPQVVASALAAQLRDAGEDQVVIAGQGLRDMTRIAASNVDLWSDILLGNAGPISDALVGLTGTLDETRKALAATAAGGPANRDAVQEVLLAGRDGQARIPGKHGAQASPYVEVAVMVEDKPGQLAQLVVAAGEAGINLEDVRIEHVLGRPSGLIELAVRPENGARLEAVLRSLGFDVRT